MTLDDYNSAVDQYSDRIYRFALKTLNDHEKAQDVVQESYTRLWKNHKNVDAKKVKSYLFTSAYHISVDTIRLQQRQTNIELSDIGTHAHTSQYSDLKEILNEAINKLPEIQRSVILLRDYEGYSYKEIADICELTEPQVKVYIYRGRVALKKYIGSLEVLI
ncbi:RNA polymerase sigma factor [Puteibacter caeruleilacunae]|nr:RNA polymerase sigma factor [Puteibacter caeruleilacunae]